MSSSEFMSSERRFKLMTKSELLNCLEGASCYSEISQGSAGSVTKAAHGQGITVDHVTPIIKRFRRQIKFGIAQFIKTEDGKDDGKFFGDKGLFIVDYNFSFADLKNRIEALLKLDSGSYVMQFKAWEGFWVALKNPDDWISCLSMCKDNVYIEVRALIGAPAYYYR